jgi:hypothetical protein
MASQQNKTLHSVVMNFIPKKVTSNNPPIIKTSLPNLDKPLSNEIIKLTYDNICNVVLKESDLQSLPPTPATKQQPTPAPVTEPKTQDNSVKTANLLEPGQTTLDNYVSVSVTKVPPKRLTKSAKVSAVKHELTVSPQTTYRRKHPLDNKPIPISVPVNTKPPQPIQAIKGSIIPHTQPAKQQQLKPHNPVVHRGRTFDDEPPIYRGKNPFHEITLNSRKSKKNKKSKKSKKNNKKSKLKKKDKYKRVQRTQSLSAGSNTREIISNDIQNIMSLF